MTYLLELVIRRWWSFLMDKFFMSFCCCRLLLLLLMFCSRCFADFFEFPCVTPLRVCADDGSIGNLIDVSTLQGTGLGEGLSPKIDPPSSVCRQSLPRAGCSRRLMRQYVIVIRGRFAT